MNFDREDGDDAFHPLGEAWQDELEAGLEESEYDSELGMQMAEDAMRVTEGELSEEAFYDRYHEAIAEEFGDEFDEEGLPMADAFESAGERSRFEGALSQVGMDGDSRREVMKKMSAGAGAVGLGAWGTKAANSDDPEPSFAEASEESDEGGDEGTQWGMALDLEHCDGCLSCVVACNEEHNWNQGANWMYILDYEDETSEADDSPNRLIRPCQHCTDAPCEKVCPTTARHTRDSDGLVLTDYNVCIGCRYCQVACPYGVNYFQWEEPSVPADELESDHVYDERGRPVSSRGPRGVMEKCTFCPTRQDGQQGEELIGRTACEDACPPEVIQFGDMNDENSDPQRYLSNTAKSRSLVRLASDLPDPEGLQESLQGAGSDLESIVDAVEDLDEDLVAVLLAIAILGEEGEPEGRENSSLAQQEDTALNIVSILEDHGLDTTSQELLVELDLAEEPEESGDGEESGSGGGDTGGGEGSGGGNETDGGNETETGSFVQEDGGEFEGPSEELAQERLVDFAGDPESSYKLLEDIGTDPNVVYLGDQPGPEAHQVEGPVAYEDVGMTDNRKNVVDDGTVDPFF
ncbi:4Fe-4S ferredoxin N-terminal domain-containing protein [Haloterrigena alkaliphila]|uniref:4Fe-4S dicluster domain-containing protein n=1 Tax=Haloterrigena alkaliphila TaxID=2816475 RepID=A0A8A2VBN5_9EURY|nr:4Fe-4S ferredoxin N-terminal domain-containing protein [Haloterrigena alkaliphila]QSW99433.1 4Fe-4S dicluster domain-containing protein [Haloterrigena alkaliphila]